MSLLFFLKPIYGPGTDEKVRYPKALHLAQMGCREEKKKEEEEDFCIKTLLLLLMED